MCLIPKRTNTMKTQIQSKRNVEVMLREIAYVLQLTRTLSEEMKAERSETSTNRPNSESDLNIVPV